jgi:Ca2+-binding RTX toxin-like protein
VLVGGDSAYTSDADATTDHPDATVLHAAPIVATDTDADPNTVAEGAAAGTEVQITAQSIDAGGGSVTYSLVGANSDAFAIDANTGVVTVADGSLIDYENSGSDHQLQITVEAKNSVGGTTDTTFTIDVTDVAPALVSSSSVGPVAEGDTAAHSLVAPGSDTSGVSYQIIANADGALFDIDANGNLTFKNPPDFEHPLDSDGDNVYRVNVLAFDNGHFVTQSYDIGVTDVAMSALTEVGGDHDGTVLEDSTAGTAVGVQVTATDGSGTPVYSIVSDSSNGGFQIDANGKVTVADGSKLDFETSDTETIVVRAQSGLTDIEDKTITIDIGDRQGSNINGGNGGDTIDGQNGPNGPQDASNLATAEGDTIHGNGGNDTIDGLAGDDTITGDAGNDTLDGSAGDDDLTGGAGKDIVRGGDDDDTIHVKGTDDVSDVIDGGNGTDTIAVDGSGNVTLVAVNDGAALVTDIGVHNVESWTGNGAGLLGTSAANVFDFSGIAATGLSFIDGGSGNDTITAGNGADYDLRGGVGNDTLTGGNGDDTITGGKGADTLDGGTGVNTVSYAGSVAVTVNLATMSAMGGDATGDTLVNFQNVIGSSKNDTLTGDANANELTGGAGVDTISGGAGDDIIHVSGTGDASDSINGGADDDTLQVDGAGNVTLAGFNGAAWDIETFVGNDAALLGTNVANTFDFTGVDVRHVL